MNPQKTAPSCNIIHRRTFTVPTFTQVEQILASLASSAEEWQVRTIISFVASTGIRPSELCKTLWSDVDFDQRTVFVDSVKAGKRRLVPFGSLVLALLKLKHDPKSDSEYLLGHNPKDGVARATCRIKELSSILCGTSFNLHALRRYFYSAWVARGGSLHVLTLMAGSSLSAVLANLQFPDACDREITSAASPQAEVDNHLVAASDFDQSEVSA